MTASPPWIKDSLPQKDSTQPGVKDLYKTTDVKADSQFIVLDDAPAGGGGGQGADVAAINADDEFADLETDPGVVAAYQDAQVAAGVWTQDDVDAARAEGANPSSPPDTTAPPVRGGQNLPIANFQNLRSFPDSMQLTPGGTTLGQIRRGAVGAYSIVPNCNLSSWQIVYNMANVAHNIWEPLKRRYPDAFITSSFRSNSRSQHGRGQAIDVQFRRVPATEYLDRAKWIRDNLPFDQLLLECRTSGALWIHCSYYAGYGTRVRARPQGNWCATMINDGSFTPGLRDLSTVRGVRRIPAG
jgi:hypothetical protein